MTAFPAAVVLKLSVGLAILYFTVLVIWYELSRTTIVRWLSNRRARRTRGERTRGERYERPREPHGEAGTGTRQATIWDSESEGDRDDARRHYYLARDAALAERDAAVAAAGRAAKDAIARIEARYREIDEGLRSEEAERIAAEPGGDEPHQDAAAQGA